MATSEAPERLIAHLQYRPDMAGPKKIKLITLKNHATLWVSGKPVHFQQGPTRAYVSVEKPTEFTITDMPEGALHGRFTQTPFLLLEPDSPITLRRPHGHVKHVITIFPSYITDAQLSLQAINNIAKVDQTVFIAKKYIDTLTSMFSWGEPSVMLPYDERLLHDGVLHKITDSTDLSYEIIELPYEDPGDGKRMAKFITFSKPVDSKAISQ